MQLALLCGALALVAGAVGYRFVWLRRYRTPPARESGAIRLQGEIRGPGPRDRAVAVPGSFELSATDETQQVVYLDRVADLASGEAVRVGQRVTVDGVPRCVPAPAAETLYRQQGSVPGVDATRVVAGCWPRLRWLVPASSLAALAALALAVARPYWVSPRQRVLEQTEAAADCPRHAVRETRVGPDGVLHRCRHEGGYLHGIYTVWSWDGTLVERGQWLRGRRHGIHDVRTEDGEQLRRSNYYHGELHGPVFVLAHPFTRFSKRRYHAEYVRGRLHGTERGWYEDGKRAFVRYYLEGRPVGTWTVWDRRGLQRRWRVDRRTDGARLDGKG